MTMIYHPIPFIKLVQKFLVENYELIMRICGKNMYNSANSANSANSVHVVN